MESLAMLPQSKAAILVVLPKLLQGVFAAVGDYFTWKLAERIYGCESSSFSWTAVRNDPAIERQSKFEAKANCNMQLLMSVLSPWQWFCSTRTLSNSLEVALTAGALYLWPWGLPGTLLVDSSAKSGPNFVPVSGAFRSNSDFLRHVCVHIPKARTNVCQFPTLPHSCGRCMHSSTHQHFDLVVPCDNHNHTYRHQWYQPFHQNRNHAIFS
jgi:hypothetical protein